VPPGGGLQEASVSHDHLRQSHRPDDATTRHSFLNNLLDDVAMMGLSHRIPG
jgi:hypothetical protein